MPKGKKVENQILCPPSSLVLTSKEPQTSFTESGERCVLRDSLVAWSSRPRTTSYPRGYIWRVFDNVFKDRHKFRAMVKLNRPTTKDKGKLVGLVLEVETIRQSKWPNSGESTLSTRCFTAKPMQGIWPNARMF
ncbi:hypothetical protein GQ457_07G038040 [Hibiscus cannabinus]